MSRTVLLLFWLLTAAAYSQEISQRRWTELEKEAREAVPRSEAHWTNSPTGAAVLTKSGKIFGGAQYDTVGFDLTTTALRHAVSRAAFEAPGDPIVAALSFDPSAEEPTLPGMSGRRVLAEFASGMKIPVRSVGGKGSSRDDLLESLAPGLKQRSRPEPPKLDPGWKFRDPDPALTAKLKDAAGMNEETFARLVQAARDGALRAYAPVSGFHVGVAVYTDAGIFNGANLECDEIDFTIHAERLAILRARWGKKDNAIKALVVYCHNADVAIVPCMSCRQVMAEYLRDAMVVAICRTGDAKVCSFRDIAKWAYEPAHLDAKIK